MATYKNHLRRVDGTPILGAQACLYNKYGQRLDVDITEEEGLYYFLNVMTGHYQVRFFGQDLTDEDWIEIDVIDEISVNESEIIFVGTPILSVIEIDPMSSLLGPSTEANFIISNLLTQEGTLADVSLFYKLSTIDEEWKLLKTHYKDL